ncbi:MAG: hypothetical protein CM1200mP30_32150 [Pseudomonadota bacterium]|nr:MAG: hypothetical protein CM1200mP30_32150 [Pseudomonadota bacterium]
MKNVSILTVWKYVRWEAFHEGPDMLYIHPETCIDCNACVEECPVEAIYADVDVPEKWEHYTPLNAEKCEEYPVILKQKILSQRHVHLRKFRLQKVNNFVKKIFFSIINMYSS